MPTPDEIHIRQQAEQSLRRGNARQALGLYRELIGHRTEGNHYQAWLMGTATAYLALGRTREAGYVLLALRRYADAQRYFPSGERPLEWAFCASRLGRHGEAARVFSEAGHPALAAIELEAAGAGAAARLEWERVLRDPRLAGHPYETALTHFNLGEALLRLGDRVGAGRELGAACRLLEVVADDLESAGENVRAFDCYSVIVRLGKDIGSFETVSEGYLNMIRLIVADDNVRAVQYYDDFMRYAVEQKEWYAAATLAREVAEHCLRVGLAWDRHYQARAAELWIETARANQAAAGPVDLSANALQAAVDAASALGDFALAGRVYADLAELPLPDVRRQRYRSLARRYESEPTFSVPSPAFPDVLRRLDSYQDVWRQDLVEWELDGDPVLVLARLLAESGDHLTYVRPALQAILKSADAGFSLANPAAAAEMAVALGQVKNYVVLRPLERLFERPEPKVRADAMKGLALVWNTRALDMARKALGDPEPAVVDQALATLRGVTYVDALPAVARMFRESSDDRVRLAALEGVGTIARTSAPQAALVLLDAARQETGTLQKTAVTLLRGLRGDDVASLLRQARDAEIGERRDVFDDILKAVAR
jgi:tetratricopeptide (TPR) repeat protein